MSGSKELREYRLERYLIYGSVFVALTGLQLIVPVLPAVQEHLALDDAQIALVTGVYLLPTVPAALLSGVLADRFGRGRVLGTFLVLFGVAGVLVGTVGLQSFPVLLFFRALQGVGYAGVNPLTITTIGDLFRGPTQVAVQGHRSLTMQAGDTALPVLGGILLGWSLVSPFLLPALAIPLGLATMRLLSAGTAPSAPVSISDTLRAVIRFGRQAPLLALQVAGFVRFTVKFTVLTYLPILAVNQRGLTPAAVGLAIGAASLTGGVTAVSAKRLLTHVRMSGLIVLSLLLLGVSVLAFTLAHGVGTVTTIAIIFGAGDGLYGVLQNALVADAVEGAGRTTFVAATGAVRNAGKFLAPVIAAGITMVASVSASFVFAAVVAFAAILCVPPLRDFDAAFAQH